MIIMAPFLYLVPAARQGRSPAPPRGAEGGSGIPLMDRFKVHLLRALVISTVYLLAFAVSRHLIYPLQLLAMPAAALPVAVIFLPHAVRVIGAWLYGWASVAYILPGIIAKNLVEMPMGVADLRTLVMIGFLLISAPLCFSIMACAFDAPARESRSRMNWRMILIVGLLSAMMNALAVVLAQLPRLTYQDISHLLFRTLLGNMLGLVCGLLIALLAFRLFEWRLARR